MKAIILAAGKGVRMLPLTLDKPKVLIEINGKPFLWYVIENLKKAGVTEFAIIANHKIEKMLKFLTHHNIKATLLQQPEPLGTGDAVKQARDFCGQDNFIIVS
ncbi:MAG TPA: sugar phosphate nucleotidyltransferase, partial [Candidatus Nanoarchaeia archaeon]|nr:sugar phosphate nucleotidyltransferase [Candidatus Nanoarchaeia archaeon]